MKQQEEDRWLLARCRDAIRLGEKSPQFVGFLDEREVALARQVLQEEGCENARLWGGYEGAERQMLGVFPDYWPASEEEFPIAAVTVRYRREDSLSHRDFLGAVLGLGLDREKVGDLLVGETSCDLLVLEDIAEFLLLHLDQAGRARLKLAPLPLSAVEPPPVQVKLIRDTVATLRLDAVAASGFSLARGKASDAISAGRVQLNHQECVKPDRAVAQGDVISCRGLGKCVVKEVGGPSKKGRIMLVLERYV